MCKSLYDEWFYCGRTVKPENVLVGKKTWRAWRIEMWRMNSWWEHHVTCQTWSCWVGHCSELSPLHLTDVTSPYWSDSVQAEGSGLEYLCVVFVHFFFLRKVWGRRKTCLVFLKSKEAARWFWFISEPWHAKREHVDNHTCSLAWLQSELVDRSHWKAKQTLQSVFKLNWRLPKVFSSAPKLNLALNKHGTLQTYSEPRTLNWERKGVGMNNKAQYVPGFKWIILGLKSGHERDVLETL